MGWETTLTTHISFNRKTYNNKYEVEEDLQSVTKEIEDDKSLLKSLCIVTEPGKMMSPLEIKNFSPINWITTKFDDAWERLIDNLWEHAKLQILLHEWDKCHTKEGLAIPDPEGVEWNSSFLDGDFINTVEKDGN